MTDETLTGIQRSLVLDCLKSERPVLHVQPLKPDRDGRQTMRYVLLPGTDDIFSVSDLPQRFFLPGTNVRIRFYYRQLGLYFDTELQERGGALSFAVPGCLRKINDLPNGTDRAEGSLICTEDGQPPVRCTAHTQIRIFDPFVWKELPQTDNFRSLLKRALGAEGFCICPTPQPFVSVMAKTGRALYIKNGRLPRTQPFSFEACILFSEFPAALPDLSLSGLFIPLDSAAALCAVTGNDIASGKEADKIFALFQACRCLDGQHRVGSIQNRAEPFKIVHISHYGIALVRRNSDGNIRLHASRPYALTLNIGTASGKRILNTSVTVQEQRGIADGECVYAAFDGLCEEDKRFLYETGNSGVYA